MVRNTSLVHIVGYDPDDEKRRESLFSLGNGMLLLRSACPWSKTDDHHYPGMYYAGCYNPLPSQIQGETVWNESIVNLPNGLALSYQTEDGAWFSLEDTELLHYEQVLDLRTGVMKRNMRFRESSGRVTALSEERFVSMDAPNLVGLRLTLTPHNWSGPIVFRSQIDTSVVNNAIEKHEDYAHKHLRVLGQGSDGNALHVEAQTINSHFNVAVRTRDFVSCPLNSTSPTIDDESVGYIFSVQAEAERPITIDRIMAVFIGPSDGEDVEASARQALAEAPGYDALLDRHCSAWAELWDAMPLASADRDIEQAQQLALFHLLQNYSHHNIGRDVGFPARGWQEAYRGQVFWDEMFSVPVISLRFPELAREMLQYRYTRLDAARENARKYGLKGALYPWRSARTGHEETPRFQKNPSNGHWREDHTDHQVHINAAIVWDIFHYVWATGDKAFFNEQGLEMLVEIARMWASLAVCDPQDGRYDIRHVVGPDEFHTQYATRDKPGIDNNSYTNLTAAWTLAQAIESLDAVPLPLRNRLGIGNEEIGLWDQISRRLRVPFSASGLVCQFENVETLKQIDPDSLGQGSADWELEQQGKDVNDYQLFKQTDFAVLFYLLTLDQVQAIFSRLGYKATAEQLHRSIEYYRQRTSHGSSLSQVSYAAALLPFDPQLSWSLWREALAPDLDAQHAQSAAEGLHLGAMAASLDVLQRHYLGLSPQADGLHLRPAVPEGLPPVRFGFCYCGGRFDLHWNGASIELLSAETNTESFRVVQAGCVMDLAPGQEIRIAPTHSGG
ncbi:glycoside hydrolase family 65 protein [Devosia submarina]|uniref:glycoside hydrolase family 65 protein n=1 Tax=Devosia submarina TaxID=1173082 RepID=UPI000D3858CD|nr:glycoside hydrolase family 65 protein [Devosia submarina]